jgi:hypothetical protein
MRVRVRHAARGSAEETLSLGTFLARCARYFEDDGRLIDQAYQDRLAEGMVRCYLAGAAVVGFGEQQINALYPAAVDGTVPLPGPRLYFPPTRPDFQSLKAAMERVWLPELCRRCALEPNALPVIWDADFIRGPRGAGETDGWVLCEINVSCVSPFPDEALGPIATLTRARLRAR